MIDPIEDSFEIKHYQGSGLTMETWLIDRAAHDEQYWPGIVSWLTSELIVRE